MRTLLLLGVVGLLAPAAGISRAQEQKMADLKVGDPAPVFELQDDQGKTWKSTDVVGKKILVVYFFPAAFTGG
jgi:peroxiredoxin Q/BCP